MTPLSSSLPHPISQDVPMPLVQVDCSMSLLTDFLSCPPQSSLPEWLSDYRYFKMKLRPWPLCLKLCSGWGVTQGKICTPYRTLTTMSPKILNMPSKTSMLTSLTQFLTSHNIFTFLFNSRRELFPLITGHLDLRLHILPGRLLPIFSN